MILINSNKHNRTHNITIRLSDHELDLLNQKVLSSGLSKSQFIRNSIFNTDSNSINPINISDIRQLVFHLKSINNLISNISSSTSDEALYLQQLKKEVLNIWLLLK